MTVRVVTSTPSRPIFWLFLSQHLDSGVSPRMCWTRFGNSVWKHLRASSNMGEKSSSHSSSFLFLRWTSVFSSFSTPPRVLLLRAKSSTASSEAATLSNRFFFFVVSLRFTEEEEDEEIKKFGRRERRFDILENFFQSLLVASLVFSRLVCVHQTNGETRVMRFSNVSLFIRKRSVSLSFVLRYEARETTETPKARPTTCSRYHSHRRKFLLL